MTAPEPNIPSDEQVTRDAAYRTPRALVVVFASVGFFAMTTSLMTAGLLPLIADDFSVSEGLAGSLIAVFALAIVLTILPMTRWTVRLSRRAVIVATVAALVLSNLTVASAPSLSIALGGRFIGGAAYGLLSATIPATVSRIVPAGAVPRAMGPVLAGNIAGFAFGAPLTAALGTSFGWRSSFAIAGVVGLGIALAVFRTVPSIRLNSPDSGSMWAAVHTPGVLRMSISWGLVLLGNYIVLTFVTPIFIDLGGTQEDSDLALLVLGVAGVAGVVLAGRLRPTMVFGGAIASAIVVALAFLGLLLWPPLFIVYIMLALWGAGSAASLLLNQQCVLLAGHRAPEMSIGLAVFITQIGVVLGSSAGGIAIETLGTEYLPLMGMVATCIALVILIGMPQILREAREEQINR